MKHIISFSLWGDKPIYNIGAIKNAELAKIIYPGWLCRFYIGKSVPIETVNKLKEFDNVELINMDSDGDWTAMFWRFYPASDYDVEVVLVRDCDSRLSIREKLAVDEWLKSDKGFHIMRDHPHHTALIMGGMWGAKKGVIPNMKELIDNYTKGNFWQVDQDFLRDVIYPKIKNNYFVHDDYFEKKPFPVFRIDDSFIGEKINV